MKEEVQPNRTGESSNQHLEQRLGLMKGEIDALQIAVTGASKPWYKDLSTWLSVAALLFSFGTTYVSYRHTEVQDIGNARQELRGLLQRLSVLPKENVEAFKKYAGDPASTQLVSSFINQENALLARNAAEISRKLPPEYVSATEYYAIAVALHYTYDLAGATEFLTYSQNAKPDFGTELAILRMLANMRFSQGAAEAGRVEYQKALDIFAKYPQYDAFTKANTNITTELSWAADEANNNFAQLVPQHIDKAKSYLANLPSGPGLDSLVSQIAQVETNISRGNPAVPVQVIAPAGSRTLRMNQPVPPVK